MPRSRVDPLTYVLYIRLMYSDMHAAMPMPCHAIHCSTEQTHWSRMGWERLCGVANYLAATLVEVLLCREKQE